MSNDAHYMRLWRQKKKKENMPSDLKHGDYAYRIYGCRCSICKAEHAKRYVKYSNRRKKLPIPSSVIHGKYNTYNYYGCRCDKCRQANAKRIRMYRKRELK